jgi:hypothetical protein
MTREMLCLRRGKKSKTHEEEYKWISMEGKKRMGRLRFSCMRRKRGDTRMLVSKEREDM